MAENASFITRLPPEILALIFANLSLRHRVQCLCICRSWRAFLFSWSGLWNELSDNEGYDMIKMFTAYMQSSPGTPMRYRIDSIHIHATRRRKHKQIMRLFKEYQKRCRIQSVHLHGDMSRYWFRRMIRLEDMVRLTLNGVSNPAPDKVFAIVLRECPNLKHFVYHTAWSASAHAPAASPSSSFNWSFPPHHKLLSLDMYLHARVDNFPLHRLLSSLPSLVAIRLNPYDFDGAAHVLHMLQQHPFLQAIRFNYHDNDVDEEQLQRGKGGGGLCQLQIQELCGIDDTALIPFLIQHHTTLRILDIHFAEHLTHLTASTFASLSFSVLERISLSNLVGAHPSHLMAFFARATRLRQVRIFALDAFNDKVLYTLGQYATRLESLYLAHCENITPNGLLQFATTAKCKSTTLALCQVDHDMMDPSSTSYDDDNVVAAIRQALPQLVSM